MLRKSCSPACGKAGKSPEELLPLIHPLRVALVGNPNTGKTTLFNALTGLRHHVANYPGVTVEKRWGLANHDKIRLEVLDLPGIASLEPRSQDEKVVHDVLYGRQEGTAKPQVIIALADPFHLEKNLYLVSQLRSLHLPVVLAMSFMDQARKKGLKVDLKKLEARLGVPVIPVSGLRREGLEKLREKVAAAAEIKAPVARGGDVPSAEDPQAIYRWVEKVIDGIFEKGATGRDFRAQLDAFFLHPLFGPMALAAIMFLVFQAIFSWATLPMDAITGLCDAAGSWVHAMVPQPLLAGFLADGVIAGVGSVLVFLPQIFLLFFFIGILEDTGYLARAAFLLDKLMSKVGLNGKAFLPLFSCFACAVPGIMATRVIENRRERLTTILVAPFMSCSARIPVYALVTAALIPPVKVLGVLNLQAVTFFGMYVLGIVVAVAMSWIFKSRLPSKESSHFFLELPPYRMPHWRTLVAHVWERSGTFVKSAGTIILLVSMALWVLTSFPRPASVTERYARERAVVLQTVSDPAQRAAEEARIDGEESSALLKQSVSGRLGHFIEPAIRPLGFDWKIGVGVLASFFQREVIVSTLAIIYNVGSDDRGTADLGKIMREEKNPVTGKPLYPPLVGISILVFYALACQCISTLAVVRRETGTWLWPAFMFAYMTALAYAGSFLVYQGGKLLGLA